jgi:hypothetical protein
MGAGSTGGRRTGARLAATIWGYYSGTQTPGVPPPNGSPPSLSRANDSAAGTPSPAFDYSNTYAASASASWTTAGLFTVSGGLAAHGRPFVPGQLVNCSPACGSGLVIKSVSLPPTQDTRTGQGQVGQTFTFQTFAPSGGSLPGSASSGTATAGCTSGSGGSNCINIDFTINTTAGTFGTAAAIATCGANNSAGNAPNYQSPAGKCQDNGVGEIVRAFRIGTQQNMYGNAGVFPTGSVFDDGVDFWTGAFNQSAAFTCNIVAAKTVQCVHAPTYTSGVPSGIGKWSSGSTFLSYGDMTEVSGRMQGLLGYVGGQSFPIANAGSGYSPNSTIPETLSCPTVASGWQAPTVNVTVSGGAVVNVAPATSGYGVGGVVAPGAAACTVPMTGFTGGSGASISIALAPVEGDGGIGTFNTDENTMGMFLYDNTGFPGNPLNSFFTNGQGGYFEPGLPVRPIGNFLGAAVSG